ncbi:MAG: hypothetical protein ABI162_06900 [Luteolibacter sp.]
MKKFLLFLLPLVWLGVSGCTSTVAQTPTPPAYSTDLSWAANAASENVTRYTAYERSGVTTFTYSVVATVTPPVVSAHVTGLTAGSHTYVVTASNVAGESVYSDPATIAVPKAPGKVSSLKAVLVPGP